MSYIVSCTDCGHRSLIEAAGPKEVAAAACPICSRGESLKAEYRAEDMLPTPEEIARMFSLDKGV
ncbi:hypothetical protein [Halarsenatibacter silvermanii]|uniref:Regulatory protein, FmdB family n=1 Tax=Halarsenatibacter silvermanii TaxID=321763 RepID=A0A1G9MVG0_9FIRM|nr:hypothetical protein [Halarsenatibacter silvermanii]SDL78262.1 hypothetical protein SAMN04488692_10924 [Halarsenatibacter silvermanii]